MNKKIPKRQQTEWNFVSEKNRKKRVNAKKFARSVLLLFVHGGGDFGGCLLFECFHGGSGSGGDFDAKRTGR